MTERLKTQFDVGKLVRPNIRDLRPYTSARSMIQEGLLLDANESPYENRWSGIALNRYPDPNQTRLRSALADYLGVPSGCILAGAGSDEVIDWILKVFCQPGVDCIATAAPSYGMYRVQADVLGVDLVTVPLIEDQGFDFKAEAFLSRVRPRIKALFLCSPNNPTGNLMERSQALKVCREWPGIVVVDEAYIEFANADSMAKEVEAHPNLVVMRTFSKAFGRAAIRLGYAVASPEIIRYFAAVKAPYNLNSVSLELGVQALRSASQVKAQIEEVRGERSRVARQLRSLGVEKVFPSEANFLLFRCRRASRVASLLRDRGVIIRDRTSAVPECLRVTIGTPQENDRFLGEIQSALEGLDP